ncbi:hypothetical protein J6590_105802, partial [Homalodisca vitripennis]
VALLACDYALVEVAISRSCRGYPRLTQPQHWCQPVLVNLHIAMALLACDYAVVEVAISRSCRGYPRLTQPQHWCQPALVNLHTNRIAVLQECRECAGMDHPLSESSESDSNLKISTRMRRICGFGSSVIREKRK